ncbi:hypothetical protein B0H21DRAFT_695711, partial [Amylocystis lapponica]
MPLHPPSPATQPQLRVKQQNCKHSLLVSHTLVNSTDPAQWDLVLIQEPYVYPNSRLTPASRHWITIYPPPTPNSDDSPKSVILVSTRLNPDCYQQINLPSQHVTAIRLCINNMSLLIFNVYNPPRSDTAL